MTTFLTEMNILNENKLRVIIVIFSVHDNGLKNQFLY